MRLVKERIPARFGLHPKSDIQVLTPMNRSLLGARNLNQVLQQALNPGTGGPEVQRFGWTFRIGDRVIQTENDYDKDVFNGDLGVVEGPWYIRSVSLFRLGNGSSVVSPNTARIRSPPRPSTTAW